MPEPSSNRMQKALKTLTIGTVTDLKDFEKDARLDGLGETEEQVWINFSGLAEEFASWVVKDIEFVQHFVDATGNRDSPFDRPHFTYGVVLDTTTPVAVWVNVLSYKVNDRNETLGATIAIGVASVAQPTQVKGRVNLTFQGYAQEPSGLPDDIGVG